MGEGDQIAVPGNDVDLLAFELAGDGLNAGALEADAGAHRIHVAVLGKDRHLGALARFADTYPDDHGAVVDLRDLHLQELPQEHRRGA